jgi:hypothetical protein
MFWGHVVFLVYWRWRGLNSSSVSVPVLCQAGVTLVQVFLYFCFHSKNRSNEPDLLAEILLGNKASLLSDLEVPGARSFWVVTAWAEWHPVQAGGWMCAALGDLIMMLGAALLLFFMFMVGWRERLVFSVLAELEFGGGCVSRESSGALTWRYQEWPEGKCPCANCVYDC